MKKDTQVPIEKGKRRKGKTETEKKKTIFFTERGTTVTSK